MVKRKLSEDEKKLCLKSFGRAQEELKWVDYQLAYHILMLDVGLKENYFKNVRDFKEKKREFEEEKKIIKEKIEILQHQIREGVEIKKVEKEVEGNG